MAVYTFTTTAVQEAALAAQLATINAAVVAQNAQNASMHPPVAALPVLDKPTYLTQTLNALLAGYGTANQAAVATACIQAYAGASAANQSQVLSLLGIPEYSALPLASQLHALALIGLQNFLSLTPAQQNQAFALVGLTA